MTIRTEIVDALVAEGKKVFSPDDENRASHFPHGVPQYNVLSWLFMRCSGSPEQLDTLEQNEVVARVHQYANKAMDVGDAHSLTVAGLRNVLQGLPENLPVLYQRIEDVMFEKHGWTAVPLTWSVSEATAEDIAVVQSGQYPYIDLIERDGKTLYRELSGYISAFGAYVVTDDQGNRAVCIHAHY